MFLFNRRALFFINKIVLLIFVVNVSSERVKRIVGGDPASRPPPPGSVNYIDETYPGDVSSSTTSTTPEPDFEESNDPIVFPKRGARRAQVTGVNQDGYYAFKGIKYAQPPVGRLRFQRPVRLHMNGKIVATQFGPPCPQPLPNNRGVIGQEDCLYLNVFTPKLPVRGDKKDGGLPVVFWIHGGGFRRGSASQYGPKDLVNKGVVVVTVQYRLGSLGFLNRKNKDVPGNVGLFDINAALRWVREYIRFFGGNPKHVILSGQGSGASAACMAASSKFNSDSVRGVVAMSGSSVSSFAVDEKENVTSDKVAELNSCKEEDSVKFIHCMQKVPFEKIIEADSEFQDDKVQKGNAVKTMGSPLNPSPTVEGGNDGRFLPFFNTLPPIEALKAGDFVKVPLLTGVTKEETSTCVKGNLFGQVQKLFGAADDFLRGGLFKELLTVNTGLYSNGSVNPTLDTLFNSQDYVSAMTTSISSAASQAEKLIEATTDALFNLPAFLTSQLWSKKSDAFLYQFDHESDKSNGKLFLDGLPLVQTDQQQPSKGLGHGDDLIYLFDPCTLEGEPIKDAQLTSEKDKKVRDYFTSMVAEFARTGKPQIKGAGVQGWSPFKDESSEYLELSDKPQVKSGFRKCQMALWAGLSQALKSAECSALNAGELIQGLTGAASSNLLEPTNLRNVGSSLTQPLTGISSGLSNTAKDTTSILTNPVGLLGGGGNNKNDNSGNSNPIGGLFNLGGNNNNNNRPKPSPKPPTNPLGGFLG